MDKKMEYFNRELNFIKKKTSMDILILNVISEIKNTMNDSHILLVRL